MVQREESSRRTLLIKESFWRSWSGHIWRERRKTVCVISIVDTQRTGSVGVLSGECCENKWMLTLCAGEACCRQSCPSLQLVFIEHLLFTRCCAGAGEAAGPKGRWGPHFGETHLFIQPFDQHVIHSTNRGKRSLSAYSILDAFSFNL